MALAKIALKDKVSLQQKQPVRRSFSLLSLLRINLSCIMKEKEACVSLLLRKGEKSQKALRRI